MKVKKAEQKSQTKRKCKIHEHRDHQHGENCGHKAIKHGDHTDYDHDGELHRLFGPYHGECRGGHLL